MKNDISQMVSLLKDQIKRKQELIRSIQNKCTHEGAVMIEEHNPQDYEPCDVVRCPVCDKMWHEYIYDRSYIKWPTKQ